MLRILLLVLFAFPAIAEAKWYKSPYTLNSAGSQYRNSDPITTVHESTHGVNSMLRNKYSGECYYVGSGRFFRLQQQTGVTLSSVAAACKFRGGIFDLYLRKQQQYWNDNALYLYDEWVAYTNGADTAVNNRTSGQAWSEVQFACEMGYYCTVVLQLTPTTYGEYDELRYFWRWQAQRCVTIADKAEKENVHYRATIRPWREWLRAQLAKTAVTGKQRKAAIDVRERRRFSDTCEYRDSRNVFVATRRYSRVRAWWHSCTTPRCCTCEDR